MSYLKPNVVKAELEPKVAIEKTDENLSTKPAWVIINPYETEALTRFTASVSCNGLS